MSEKGGLKKGHLTWNLNDEQRIAWHREGKLVFQDKESFVHYFFLNACDIASTDLDAGDSAVKKKKLKSMRF